MAYQSKNTDEHVTFADALLSKRYRKAQNDFLNQVDTLIDWRPIRTLINKKYTKRQNAIGAPAYDVILLFKMLLLETWYNLSDCALEERINDSITFSRFLGLKMEEVSPDHSTISRFRSALTELGLMDKLLAQFNKQLSRHHISVREGVLVNASLVEIRSTIERTFGSIRRWFHGGQCRYRGLAKTHTQNILESIAFNLYRTPGIIMSSSVG
ncbi:IS5/IS1182 family transposase [Porphyromonas gingivalis]|uniref:IS5/IS1182 family transposase n=1 Tax=Porphyromonas gingivalis TaxID=837 RepID=UPI000975047C|nr:IS5/IS1182 family transposase [Porphyromonas gingivalis]ATR92819.1 IS5/IS1182 family transposase [Porphyromonas gingivalis]ATS07877.1 IS5/IS1182 family transposase [Porphyromonas gingivalis]SJL21480.1 ISPg1 transposase [Porphyromonas gingivalis]